ncbi:hypothetical protein BPAE_0127g00080 [Botrytis paeoniae]|uniref:Uncharacterized protein n=1 Tax=Botrytis paeoniae TaxID=278948 RepID=A0A4Z1FJL7_9HELO|nr:hypothetical protein BPAE_0127g00080 [Botrytis paeoniae]
MYHALDYASQNKEDSGAYLETGVKPVYYNFHHRAETGSRVKTLKMPVVFRYQQKQYSGEAEAGEIRRCQVIIMNYFHKLAEYWP